MFIREVATLNRASGKVYTYHKLIKSVHTAKGPRQSMVMHLGVLDVPKEDWPRLAALIEAALDGKQSLLGDCDDQSRPGLSQIASTLADSHKATQSRREQRGRPEKPRELTLVDLDSAETSMTRPLGPSLVGHVFWNRLGFPKVLTSCGFSEEWLAAAEVAIVGKLVSPGSEKQICEWYKDASPLEELMGPRRVPVNNVYQVADKLLDEATNIERGLREISVNLFSVPDTLLLYDLTNTYIEGSAKYASLIAKRGKSKEKRSDCPLITLALGIDSCGFVTFSQIYPGNQSEPQTLTDVLSKLDADRIAYGVHHTVRPTLIMDRGIATTDNLALIKEQKYPYVIIERRALEKHYRADFAQHRETFEEISDAAGSPVYVKRIPWENGSRVLCISDGRDAKETAIDTTQEAKFLVEVTKVATAIEKRKLRDVLKVGERLGRIKNRFSHISQYYSISVSYDDGGGVSGLQVTKKPDREARTDLTGCYVMETSNPMLSASETWHQYMMLTRVEEAFRALKSRLGLRPIFHQKADRMKAHLFITVLAYHLLNAIEYSLRQKGDTRNWTTIKRALATLTRHTLHINGQGNLKYRLELTDKPEPPHKVILDALNVPIPPRPSRPKGVSS
jgi:transposase